MSHATLLWEYRSYSFFVAFSIGPFANHVGEQKPGTNISARKHSRTCLYIDAVSTYSTMVIYLFAFCFWFRPHVKMHYLNQPESVMRVTSWPRQGRWPCLGTRMSFRASNSNQNKERPLTLLYRVKRFLFLPAETTSLQPADDLFLLYTPLCWFELVGVYVQVVWAT